MDLSSTGFTSGGDMPRQYTCEGDDLAPPLSWGGVPDHRRSVPSARRAWRGSTGANDGLAYASHGAGLCG